MIINVGLVNNGIPIGQPVGFRQARLILVVPNEETEQLLSHFREPKLLLGGGRARAEEYALSHPPNVSPHNNKELGQ